MDKADTPSPAPGSPNTISSMEINQEILDQSIKNSISNVSVDSRSRDFVVIWNNLTHIVDSRPWYTKAREKFCCSHQAPIDEREQTIDQHQPSPSQQLPSPNHQESSLSKRSKTKVILDKLCGDAKSRQLTAIMGPSGAGKSTLLHCLFQNRFAGTTGQILVDSKSKSKLKVCFIPQHDYLNEWLTVREDLTFVSKLKSSKYVTTSAKHNSSLSTTNNNSTPLSMTPKDNYVSFGQDAGGCQTALESHDANVARVSEMLGLTSCLDVMIKNISGGQKKRLSIARELMSNPDVLILDEPTTGLDSLTCYKTVTVLKELAHCSPNPMAIVVTIHQPQREVFELFDKTYFMSRKGTAIYDDDPKNATQTIENIAMFSLPSPNYNPATYLIEIAADLDGRSAIEVLSCNQKSEFHERYNANYLNSLIKTKSKRREKQSMSADASRNYQTSRSSSNTHLDSSSVVVKDDETIDIKGVTQGTKIELMNLELLTPEIERHESPVSSSTDTIDRTRSKDTFYISHQLANCLSAQSSGVSESFRHVFILTHRSWLSVIRNPSFTKSRFIFHTMLPLFMLVVFGSHHGAPNNCPKLASELSIQDMTKSLDDNSVANNREDTRLTLENMTFFFIMIYGFGINIISCTASFYPLTMHMFKKEVTNGLYSPAPYFIGQMLAELPMEFLYPTLSILLAYPLSGQVGSYLGWRMFTVAYIMFLVSYVTHALGLLSGSIFVNNISLAVLGGQLALVPFIMLSGFFLRPPRMPKWLKSFSMISPYRTGMSALIAARYGFDLCDCDEDLLPREGERVGFGMPENVKKVIGYLFPNAQEGNSTEDNLDVNEVFEKLSNQFVKSQTFGLDIRSCQDMKPHIMHLMSVESADLFICIGLLILTAALFKIITFYIMKTFPHRIT